MLTIRNAQMHALAEGLHEDFVQRTCQYFRLYWEPECRPFDDAALLQFVGDGRAQAGILGFSDDNHILLFLEATLLFGEDFVHSGRYRWAADLADPRMTPRIKAANLRDRIREALEALAG